MEGRDSLSLLSQFKLYKIIQHRNVQEVIMQIYKSVYSVEGIPFDLYGVYNINSKR